jgi:small subunit ribosomal protein S17
MIERKERKEKIGLVSSNSMDKSIVVTVERRVQHPMYGKFVKKSSKFIAHDEGNTCNIGDKVSIMETRPMSKKKCWRLIKIIEKAK